MAWVWVVYRAHVICYCVCARRSRIRPRGGRWLLMPRRTLKKSPKSKHQLRFVQTPLDGASHSYGPKVRSARNPKIFLSEEQRQSSSTHSWVTPQFDSSMMSRTLRPHRSRGRKKGSSSRNVPDSSSLLCLPRHGKASVCKFPALSFQRRAPAPPRPPVPPVARRRERAEPGGVREDRCNAEPGAGPSPNRHAETRPRKWAVEDAGAYESTPATAVSRGEGGNEGLDCTVNTPVRRIRPSFTDSGFTPPDVETPDVLQASRSRSATQETCLAKLRLLFPHTPLKATPPPVLVSDTPEEHYGKNWRRGQLSFL